MPADAAKRADDVLRVTLARADRVVTATDAAGARAARELLRDLQEADRLLADRLARFSGSAERFTAQSMVSYQAQVRFAVRRMQRNLGRTVTRVANRARVEGYGETARLLSELEQAFTGIARPLRIRQAAALGTGRSLMAQRATSVDRYGTAMIGEFERRMRVGLLRGATQRDMVQELVGHGGPTGEVSLAAREVAPGTVERLRTETIQEGLFTRYRSWAWRIVRTETARAYSAARMEGLFEQREELPALTKKILATFDNRTAMDSVLVHGQVRRLEEPFTDGAGRVYLQPPARPNDREVVIPWLPDWSETPITSPLTPEQVEAARARANRGLDPEHQRARLAAARAASAAQRAAPAGGVPMPARQRPARPARPAAERTRAPRAPQQGEFPGSHATYRYNPVSDAMAGPALDREQAWSALSRALLNDDQPGARRAVRGWLRTNGLLSQDALHQRAGVQQMEQHRHSARALGWEAQHHWNGRVVVAADTMASARAAARSTPMQLSQTQLNAVRVLVHEEVHGASAIAASAYQGPGRVIEEACVELHARHLTGRMLDRQVLHGAYDGYISQMRDALPPSYLARERGANEPEFGAARRVTTEAWTSLQQRMGSRSITSDTQYAHELAESLPRATPQERAEYRERLVRLRP